ncbi:MAG: DUF4145 domain-containing protein [Candidatus Paceibacterota bacterium]|jgi:hypothetical protein
MLTDELLDKYILEHYTDVSNDFDDNDHLTGFCGQCKKTVGFQIIERQVAMCNARHTPYRSTYTSDFIPPYSIYFRCPSCKLFKIWIVFERRMNEEKLIGDEKEIRSVRHIFRVTSLPNEGTQDIPELPENPVSLRKAYIEAIRCMDANCFLASAAMFRRALQIITRDILGAKPANLANEIKSLIGTKNKLGITLTNDFSENSYIIKECGNQGAHPDVDPDLLDFAPEDSRNLYNIFLEIVSDLFVAPVAAKKAKEDLLSKRKLIN